MYSYLKIYSFIFLLGLVLTPLYAQQNLTTPRTSPYAQVIQTIGLTDLTVIYHRPGVNGRTIWGGLVPYGEVWRAGANENTTFETTDPVSIGGKILESGRYGVHILPAEKEWTVIFSDVDFAWGSFSYDEKEDIIRVKVKPETAAFKERLQYYFDNPTTDAVDAVLHWEKIKVRLPITLDTKTIVVQEIRNQLRSLPRFFWQGWNQAANYCLQNDVNLEEAMTWVDRSITMNRNFNNLRVKAGLLEKAGQNSEAEKLIAEGIELSTENELNAYGYQLLFGGDVGKAIEIFKLNIERNPDSWNVYDSLGEAYATKGEKKLAIEYYSKAYDMVQDETQKKRIEGVLANLKAK